MGGLDTWGRNQQTVCHLDGLVEIAVKVIQTCKSDQLVMKKAKTVNITLLAIGTVLYFRIGILEMTTAVPVSREGAKLQGMTAVVQWYASEVDRHELGFSMFMHWG